MTTCSSGRLEGSKIDDDCSGSMSSHYFKRKRQCETAQLIRQTSMIARGVARGVAAACARSRSMSAAAAPTGDWIVSPSAGTLLASHPSLDVKALAAKCASLSPGSGKVVITKVGPALCCPQHTTACRGTSYILARGVRGRGCLRRAATSA